MYRPPLNHVKYQTPPCGIRFYYIDPPLEAPPWAQPPGWAPSFGHDPRPCMVVTVQKQCPNIEGQDKTKAYLQLEPKRDLIIK